MKFFATLFLLASALYAADAKPAETQEWIKDQHDQTDTLAIPLDSSETEEADEERALNKDIGPQQKRPVYPRKN